MFSNVVVCVVSLSVYMSNYACLCVSELVVHLQMHSHAYANQIAALGSILPVGSAYFVFRNRVSLGPGAHQCS